MTDEEKDAAAAMVKLHEDVHGLIVSNLESALTGLSDTPRDRALRQALHRHIQMVLEPIISQLGVGGR